MPLIRSKHLTGKEDIRIGEAVGIQKGLRANTVLGCNSQESVATLNLMIARLRYCGGSGSRRSRPHRSSRRCDRLRAGGRGAGRDGHQYLACTNWSVGRMWGPRRSRSHHAQWFREGPGDTEHDVGRQDEPDDRNRTTYCHGYAHVFHSIHRGTRALLHSHRFG